MKYLDLSHTFSNEMPVYPGDPEPSLQQIANIETHGYSDHKLECTMHIGTHIDAPLHMISGGRKISELELEKFVGEGVLLDGRGFKSIPATIIPEGVNLKDKIVLILTGHDVNFAKSTYFEETPEISIELANSLASSGIKVMGIDFATPDSPPFPVHKLLLSQEILIIENLTRLEALIGVKSFQIQAIPIRLETDAAPVRVVAMFK